MSKQFRFYLLPSDIERLLDQLRAQVAFKLISTLSPVFSPAELQSPFSEYVFRPTKTKFINADCYLVPSTGAEIKMEYLPKRERWAVSESSEVIQFSGCDYDGTVLRIGRFYFQTDQLIGDAIWPKRQEFLKWADQVFCATKRLLTYSKTLSAYVGEDAAGWERSGGTLKDL
jgi:hypothetical protein